MKGLGFRAVVTPALVTLLVLVPGRCLGSGESAVIFQGNEVFRLSASAGGLDPQERADVVAFRLQDALNTGKTDFHPGFVGGEVVVVAGDRLLVTVDPQTAAMNNMDPARLAGIWANSLRRAVGMEPLDQGSVETGIASWYGGIFHGRPTASGEIFDENKFTAAHKTLPFGTMVRVTNLDNNKSVMVRINDRGPFVHGRIIDLSAAAAKAIGLFTIGLAPIRLEIVKTETDERTG